MTKPDWTLWLGCRNVRLDDAVWLSFGICPDWLGALKKTEQGKSQLRQFFDEFGGESRFNGRLDAACSCWGEGESYPEARRAIGVDYSNLAVRYLIVDLGKFGTFCDSMKWDIPDEFPRNESSIAELEAAKARIADLERQLAEALPSKYSTPLLEILNQAIAEYFEPRQNVDVIKPVVVDWVVARMKSAGLAPSKHIAEAIFTITKPLDHDPKKRKG